MERIQIRFGLDSMVPETKDFLIAPKISQLTNPTLRDLSHAREYPLSAFILNLDLTLILPNRTRQSCFNFIRNAEAAFEEYDEARLALLKYIENGGRAIAPYFASLRSFEHCLAHLYHAILSANQIGSEKQFEAGDNSILDRVAKLHNHVKHMHEKYQQVAIRNEVSFELIARKSDGSKNIDFKAEDAANVPIWLTNDELECKETKVTYSELADEIMSTYSDAINMASLPDSEPDSN